MSETPHDKTVALLQPLVAFPTVSASSNLALIDFVDNHLKQAGFVTFRIPNGDGTKAGIVAKLGGGPGGIMLSAHSDVVPVSEQDWTSPPFDLTRRSDRLYGRGTTDMKGFIASALALASTAGGRKLRRPLMICISYDEEVGCTGIRDMIPTIRSLGWKPELCIVGEPTSMRPAIGHKGKASFLATCRGSPGHSSLAPNYVNALHLAADIIIVLKCFQKEYLEGQRQDPAYSIPYSTVHVGRVQGGLTLNIVPDRATLEFELRHLSREPVEDFLARLERRIDEIIQPYRNIDDRAAIEVSRISSYPGLDVGENDPGISRIFDLCKASQCIKVPYGTEAGYFSQLGIPTVVCGPGDMERQGHQPDEYLELSQLAECDRMLNRVLDHLETPLDTPGP